jgi:hypothetical protein
MDPPEQAKTILLGSCERAENGETRCIKKMLGDEETVRKKRDAAVAEEMKILRKRDG